jgi:hypothetical protein
MDLRADTQQFGSYRASYPKWSTNSGSSLQVEPLIRNEAIFDGFNWEDATVRFPDGPPFLGRFSAARGDQGTFAHAYIILAPVPEFPAEIEGSQARSILTLSLLLARQHFFDQTLANLGMGRLFAPGDSVPVFVLSQDDLFQISALTVQGWLYAALILIAVYFLFIGWTGRRSVSGKASIQ